MKRPTALIIMDGWGSGKPSPDNAVLAAQTPNFDHIWNTCPHMRIEASGEDVGLPEGQMGNSEVGHLNIGAGRIVYQELTRITKAITDGSFFENPALAEAAEIIRERGGALHLMGLVSDGGVHSHQRHIKGLIDWAAREGLDRVYLHAFMDGRDTPPNGGLGYILDLEQHMAETGTGTIATVGGRYYAMDRDKRWERTEQAYRAMVLGEGPRYATAAEAVEASYAAGVTDEFIVPCIIAEEGMIQPGDVAIYFNFRPDRARQMTAALTEPDFIGFERLLPGIHMVTMTQYDVTFKHVRIAFEPVALTETLGEVVSELGLKQLRIAETEKYAHVTFFFNGGVEEPYPGEERILVPSPKVATYDLKPEMSAYEVADRLCERLDEGDLDLIILNFANADMVGHTGVFEAAVQAVEAVDECLGKVLDKLTALGGKALITADHGNAEQMLDPKDGKVFTAHTTNPVPLIVFGETGITMKETGRLSDIAPTLMDMMGLGKPASFTGNTLFEREEK